MASIYFCGRDLASENFIKPNLLNDSAGPFAIRSGTLNYLISDTSTINLIDGKKYCISCKSTGELIGRNFNETDSTKNFQFYFYNVANPSNYFMIMGPISKPNETIFTWDHGSGLWKLCVQFYGTSADLISNGPTISQVKIEEGVTPTAWIPSSQDLANLMSQK